MKEEFTVEEEETINMEDDGDNSEPLLTMETKLMTDKVNTEETIKADENTDKNEIIWTKETKTGPDEINWRALAAEFTMEKLWTKRDWKSIMKHFLFAFSTGFFFSALDVFTDGYSGFTFIFGTDYIKNVASPNDTSVADTESCKNIGRFVVVAEDGTESVEYFQYRCFEKNPIWGTVTLGFMFAPGFWAGAIWAGLGWQVNLCLFRTLWTLSVPFFPLVVIGTKLLGLINPGPEMKKLLARVNMVEARGESTMQFCVQLSIIMSREDRMPSYLQWATIITSFLMLNKTGMETYLRYDKPSPNIKTTMQKIAGLLPMFLTANVFKLVSGALLSVIFSWWTIAAYLVVWGSLEFVRWQIWREKVLYKFDLALHPLGIVRAGPKFRELPYSEKERTQQLLFGNAAWFVGTSIFLIVAIVLASTCPNTSIPKASISIQNFKMSKYKLSDKAIVSEEGPTLAFKILLPVLLAFGLASLGLIYWEFSDAKENIDDEDDEKETTNSQGDNHRVFEDKGTQTENK